MSVFGVLAMLARGIGEITAAAVAVALASFAAGMAARRWRPRWPNILVAMLTGTLVAALIELAARTAGGDSGLRYLDAIPRSLPPLSLPFRDAGPFLIH